MKYFWLGPWFDVPVHKGEPLPWVLQVEEFDVEPAFDHNRLVYRVSNDQLRHYRYRQWVTKPGRLVRDAFKRYLMAGRWLRQVTDAPTPIPDFVMRGHVYAMEQVERGEVWSAHLMLTVQVHRATDHQVVWSGLLDRELKIRNRTPETVVRALNLLLRQFLDEERPKLLASLRR